jgi:hypothetical protein
VGAPADPVVVEALASAICAAHQGGKATPPGNLCTRRVTDPALWGSAESVLPSCRERLEEALKLGGQLSVAAHGDDVRPLEYS